MRGKVPSRWEGVNAVRITPAYAGKRPILHTRKDFTRDHPRLCGEKTHPTYTAHAKRGSPPPMRGKGKVETRKLAGRRDHPRLCGEKASTLNRLPRS